MIVICVCVCCLARFWSYFLKRPPLWLPSHHITHPAQNSIIQHEAGVFNRVAVVPCILYYCYWWCFVVNECDAYVLFIIIKSIQQNCVWTCAYILVQNKIKQPHRNKILLLVIFVVETRACKKGFGVCCGAAVEPHARVY